MEYFGVQLNPQQGASHTEPGRRLMTRSVLAAVPAAIPHAARIDEIELYRMYHTDQVLERLEGVRHNCQSWGLRPLR